MEGKTNLSDKQQHEVHVVMYPWLAHGHIRPFLELSKRLARRGFKISFVSSPRNVEKIKPLLGPSGGRIDVVELPLPAVEGLPPGAESTSDIENDKIPLLLEAADRWEEPFHALLQRLSPHYVVYDVLQCWTSRVAQKLGIPCIVFFVTGAAVVGYNFCPARAALQNPEAEYLTTPPPGFPAESVMRLRHHEARDLSEAYKSDGSGRLRFADRFLMAFNRSSAIFANSCLELEGKYIDYLQRATGKLVFPVGPLVPEGGADGSGDSMEKLNDCDCLKWLDTQAPSSVIMVSFGSECFLSNTEVRTLALGLEESQAAFLWVLRLQPQTATAIADALPEGFRARTVERGVVVEGWAPQVRILSHPSVGAFLTHCGKNAVTEGLKFGLPLVALPMRLEQGLTARLVEGEWRVGVEVDRRLDGSFSKEDICRAVKKVMVEEEGRQLRVKATQIAEILSKESKSNLQTVIEFLTDKQFHI